MIKKILKDSFLYTLSTLMTKGIGFLMIPIYTAFFSPKDFGIMDMIKITGSILSIIIGLEIHQAVARFFPDAESEDKKKVIVSTGLWSIVTLYVTFLVIILIFIKQISLLAFHSVDYKDLLIIAFFSFELNFIYFFFHSQLKWQLKSKENVIISFIYTLLTASCTFILLKFYGFGIKAVFIAQIIASIVGIILSYLCSKDYYSFTFNIRQFKNLVSFSSPLIFSTLIAYAMLYEDRIIINIYLSLDDVGLYGIAFRFASVVSILTVGIQTALTPLIYNNYKETETPKAIAKLFNYFIIGASLFVTLLFIFSKYIVMGFAAESYLNAYKIIPWLAMSLFFSGVINFVPGIFIAKKTKWIMYINFVAFITNLGFNIIFIKLFGLLGAAYATVLSSFLYFMLYYFIGQKYYYIPFIWTRLRLFKRRNVNEN